MYDTRYIQEQEEKYKQVQHHLGQGKTLDNGCGTGLQLSKLNDFSVGLDLSSELLKKAIKRVKKTQNLIQGDSENLPFRNNVFEALTSFTVIQNVPHPMDMISESSRVTKPGKVMVFSSLKKAYEKKEFRKLFKEFHITEEYTSEEINDWIIILKNSEYNP